MDNCLVPPVPAGACVRGYHDNAAFVLASLAYSTSFHGQSGKVYQSESKAGCTFCCHAFVIFDWEMFSSRHVTNQSINRWTVASGASARPQIISFTLCVCRHQNTRVQVTVQNLRTGECFQVVVCWRKWRQKIIKQEKIEIEKWEIAFGIKIKHASLGIWWNTRGQQFHWNLCELIIDMIQLFKHGIPNKGFLFLSGFPGILRAYCLFDCWKVSQELCNIVSHKPSGQKSIWGEIRPRTGCCLKSDG